MTGVPDASASMATSELVSATRLGISTARAFARRSRFAAPPRVELRLQHFGEIALVRVVIEDVAGDEELVIGALRGVDGVVEALLLADAAEADEGVAAVAGSEGVEVDAVRDDDGVTGKLSALRFRDADIRRGTRQRAGRVERRRQMDGDDRAAIDRPSIEIQ